MFIDFVNKFIEYFIIKIDRIWGYIMIVVFFYWDIVFDVDNVCLYFFDNFKMVIVDEVYICIMNLVVKLCVFDFFLGYVIRNVFGVLLYFILKIINILLEIG